MGTIPSRSDVLRLALEAFLDIKLSETEADRRSTTGPKKRRGSPLASGAKKLSK